MSNQPEESQERRTEDDLEKLSDQGAGAGVSNGEPNTFEPEEDPDAV